MYLFHKHFAFAEKIGKCRRDEHTDAFEFLVELLLLWIRDMLELDVAQAGFGLDLLVDGVPYLVDHWQIRRMRLCLEIIIRIWSLMCRFRDDKFTF